MIFISSASAEDNNASCPGAFFGVNQHARRWKSATGSTLVGFSEKTAVQNSSVDLTSTAQILVITAPRRLDRRQKLNPTAGVPAKAFGAVHPIGIRQTNFSFDVHKLLRQDNVRGSSESSMPATPTQSAGESSSVP